MKKTAASITLSFLLVLLSMVNGLPEADKVDGPPGFTNQTIYSGFLNTAKENRKIHYVYIQAQ
jgi:hypothetical protein